MERKNVVGVSEVDTERENWCGVHGCGCEMERHKSCRCVRKREGSDWGECGIG